MRPVLLAAVLTAPLALAADPGEEVELSSAPVTALTCAQKAVDTGKLDVLTTCKLEETRSGLVVFDVAEMAFYRVDPKSLRLSSLERAFGGGSVDITGTVKAVDKKDGVATVQVTEHRVTPKPKPGAFKGCL